MMSILGCSADELGDVLKALGFWAERRLAAARGAAPTATPTNGAATAAPMSITIAPQNRRRGVLQPKRRPQPPSSSHRRGDDCRCVASAGHRAAVEQMGGGLAAPAQGTGFRTARPGKQPGDPPPGSKAARPRARSGRTATGSRSAAAMHRDAKGPRTRPPHESAKRRRCATGSIASPAKAAFDPDSPFAALSSLKAALEKRSQD